MGVLFTCSASEFGYGVEDCFVVSDVCVWLLMGLSVAEVGRGSGFLMTFGGFACSCVLSSCAGCLVVRVCVFVVCSNRCALFVCVFVCGEASLLLSAGCLVLPLVSLLLFSCS